MLTPTYSGFFNVEARTAVDGDGDPLVELNARIKADNPPEDRPENKKRQKDVDAHWTKKNNDTHYGYNNHINADEANKLVPDYTVRIPGKFSKLQIMMIEATEKYVITMFKKTFFNQCAILDE